jgi:hypothetical protein
MTLLSRRELDSVEKLTSITRAIYVMQSLGTPTLYRVGAIGIKGRNNALRRLAQCAPGDPKGAGWRYVALKVVAGRNSCQRWECDLRAAVILGGGAFSRGRVGKSDRFLCHHKGRLVSLFCSLALSR